MAMEKHYVIRETHTRTITAVGYDPSRKEIFIGCEDGVVKTWDMETEKWTKTFHEHSGWVTDFLYWSGPRLMLSSANDGILVTYAYGREKEDAIDRIKLEEPIYSMVLNPRRKQLVCGMKASITVYALDEDRECGHAIRPIVKYKALEHRDIIRCLVCHESRVYSGGYDNKLVIYDSSFTGSNKMNPVVIIPHAHDAGITALLLIKDSENNTWIITGSFDKMVKIWSPDGKLVHKLEGFLSTVTALCYVPRNKTIWVAAGTAYAYLYDPKSGDNVSDFIGTFQNLDESNYHLQKLAFFPEINQVFASTSRRQLLSWRYNQYGCITALKCRSALESIAYTVKIPILIFSGDGDGSMTKWERMQSNHFMYSKEFFSIEDCKRMHERKNRHKKASAKKRALMEGIAPEKPPPVNAYTRAKPTEDGPELSMLCTIFVEELDFIVSACEDNNIYVWGFDEDAVSVLQNMNPDNEDQQLARQYAILLPEDSLLKRQLLGMDDTSNGKLSDSVTNRVAGFVPKYVLDEHYSCVTSLIYIGPKHGYDANYLLSAGWDRRICLWNLDTGLLHDRYRYTETTLEHVELACDGVITDMAYCPHRNEFAHSSSDRMVYIREFSLDGHKMVLRNTLQGHYGEVTCVKYNDVTDKWVTGSDDGTIRVWDTSGLNDCLQTLDTKGSVSALCIDCVNGAIVAGVQNLIRVYEPDQYCEVQVNVGHTDAIRNILHITERNQYLSASWDKTLRVWNAWLMPRKRKDSAKSRQSAATPTELEVEE